MCAGKGFADFDNLPVGFGRAKINGGSHTCTPHFPGLFDLSKDDLIVLGWICEQLIVVKFEDEGNFVGVFAGNHAEYAQCGCHGITAPFYGEFDDIFGVKIDGVGGKGRAARVFDALINGEDGNVPGA